MRIAVAIPSDDTVKTDFALSLAWLMRTSKLELVPVNIRTSNITQSRFELVKASIKFNCDKLFFVDSDLCFPEDALDRLVAHEKDIVAASYVKRRTGQILGVSDSPDGVPAGATGLVRMKWMPIGFSLIDLKVFNHIPKPYFPNGFMEEIDEVVSEDYSFCDLATKAGFTLWCDLDMSHEIGHLGSRLMYWEKTPSEESITTGA